MLQFFSSRAFSKILTIMEEEDVRNAKKDAVTPQLTAKCKVGTLGVITFVPGGIFEFWAYHVKRNFDIYKSMHFRKFLTILWKSCI